MEQNKITPMQAPPQVIVIDCVKTESRKLRVAACVRVSSDSDDQEHSFANQISHYTSLISQNPEWEFVGIYADNAKSGLKADNREKFQRMLTDCRLRKIDRILTKSVSRFSRNIKDTLTTVRELKSLGVSVYFEKEGIDTDMLSSELLLTTFATLAQEESLNISRNLKMGYRARMRQGTAIQSNVPYGYRLVDKEMVICSEEAVVVRRIFDDYLAGIGMIEIANQLTKREKQCNSMRIWDHRSIGYILHNE